MLQSWYQKTAQALVNSSEPHVQNFLKLCQKLHLILLINMQFLKYTRLKLKLRVFLAGHIIAMITYCVTKIIPTCSPVIGLFFDTLIKSGYNDTSKSKYWNVLETVLSHLKQTSICKEAETLLKILTGWKQTNWHYTKRRKNLISGPPDCKTRPFLQLKFKSNIFIC